MGREMKGWGCGMLGSKLSLLPLGSILSPPVPVGSQSWVGWAQKRYPRCPHSSERCFPSKVALGATPGLRPGCS